MTVTRSFPIRSPLGPALALVGLLASPAPAQEPEPVTAPPSAPVPGPPPGPAEVRDERLPRTYRSLHVFVREDRGPDTTPRPGTSTTKSVPAAEVIVEPDDPAARDPWIAFPVQRTANERGLAVLSGLPPTEEIGTYSVTAIHPDCSDAPVTRRHVHLTGVRDHRLTLRFEPCSRAVPAGASVSDLGIVRTLSPERFRVGTCNPIRVRVLNLLGAASPFEVTLALEWGVGRDHQRATWTETVDGLGRYRQRDVDFPDVEIPREGAYDLEVIVDPARAIVDGDRRNNLWKARIVAGGSCEEPATEPAPAPPPETP